MIKQHSTARTRTRTRIRRWKAALPLAAPVIGGALVLAACSTSATSPSSTASPTGSAGPVVSPSTSHPMSSSAPAPPVPSSSAASVSAEACKHVDSLRTSLNSLSHVPFTMSSQAVITSDLKNIKAQADALKSEPAFSSSASQLNGAVDQVQKAAAGMGATPSPTQLQAVVAALDGLKSTAQPMAAKFKSACP